MVENQPEFYRILHYEWSKQEGTMISLANLKTVIKDSHLSILWRNGVLLAFNPPHNIEKSWNIWANTADLAANMAANTVPMKTFCTQTIYSYNYTSSKTIMRYRIRELWVITCCLGRVLRLNGSL